MASKISVPTVVTSGLLTLAGCSAPQRSPSTLDFGPPPQESTSQVAPGVEDTMRELAARVSRGGELDSRDGISRDEAERMMCAYLLRRAELSDASLKRSLASSDPEFTVLRDAQRVSQLGALLRELNPNYRARDAIDTSALPLERDGIAQNGAEAKLISRLIEGIYLAKADSSLLDALAGSRTERNLNQEIATWLAGLLEADLRLIEKPGSLSQAEIRERLLVDDMVVSWFSTCAASRFVESYPEILEGALNRLSPQSAAVLRGDENPAEGLATFTSWWHSSLDPERRAMWERGTPQQHRTVWMLFRSIPATAYGGYESISPVTPSPEQESAANEIFGGSGLLREAPPLRSGNVSQKTNVDPTRGDSESPRAMNAPRLPDLNSWMLT